MFLYNEEISRKVVFKHAVVRMANRELLTMALSARLRPPNSRAAPRHLHLLSSPQF